MLAFLLLDYLTLFIVFSKLVYNKDYLSRVKQSPYSRAKVDPSKAYELSLLNIIISMWCLQ